MNYDLDRGIARGRELIGVPYLHQGRDPQRGLDCSGLLLQMLYATGWEPLEPEWTQVENYGRISSWKNIEKFLNIEAKPIEYHDLMPMDLILMHFTVTPIPQHFGVVTEWLYGYPYIIHTHHAMPVVKECRFDDTLRTHAHSYWRIRGFDGE
jgi:hypothetical protein